MDGQEFTIEQLDAMHRPCCEAHEHPEHIDCRECGDPWPCPWEQRRAENAELWKVASAAIDWRNCYGEKYDAALLQSVAAFNAWRKANDVPRRE